MKKIVFPMEKTWKILVESYKLIEKITIEIRTYDKNFGGWERVKAISLLTLVHRRWAPYTYNSKEKSSN